MTSQPHNLIKLCLSVLAVVTIVHSCAPTPENVREVKSLPTIYPDYTDITIPANIAPLNFKIRGKADAVCLTATCGESTLEVSETGDKVMFGIEEWKTFLENAAGKKVDVSLTVRENGEWKHYEDFVWTVSNDSIDPILTYRLIEPDYEVFNNLRIVERNITNFKERSISDYNIVGNRCMNCHKFSSNNPNLSMMYVRGDGGGAILNDNGRLRKLDIKTDGMIGGSVYFSFSPNGRYVAFSTNIIIPAFHSDASKRLEVFDTKSDIYVADIKENKIIRSELLCDTTRLETFPTFAPDGKSIYFCVAEASRDSFNVQTTIYNLARIDFDMNKGLIGDSIHIMEVAPADSAATRGTSVCHPVVSPDGRFRLYAVAYYGTFPIWHPECDLQMMDLQTGKLHTLDIVNSDKSDSYHSWSGNSRWFVFASKRDDGLYGKPYFCHVDNDGNTTKPFLLPQEDPDTYDNTLKSFNIPELGRGSLPFTAVDVQRVMEKEAEKFQWR